MRHLDVLEFGSRVPTLAREHVRAGYRVLCAAEDSVDVRAALLHGSHTRGVADADSDLDLILVVETTSEALLVARDLGARVRSSGGVLLSRYTERFGWFGRLWSFYVAGSPPRSIDCGIVTHAELASFFVEPDAVVLWDEGCGVEARRAECYEQRVAARRGRRGSVGYDMCHAMHRVAAALDRGHLWNAFEYVSVMRRLVFEVLRNTSDAPDYVHVGRAERDIESVVPRECCASMEGTIPRYDLQEIAGAATRLYQEFKTRVGGSAAPGEWNICGESLARLEALSRGGMRNAHGSGGGGGSADGEA